MRFHGSLLFLCGVVWMGSSAPVDEEKSGYSTGFDVVGRIEISNIQQGEPGYWQTHQQGGYGGVNHHHHGGYGGSNFQQVGHGGYQDQGYNQGGHVGYGGVAVLQPLAIGYANPVQTYQSVPSYDKYEHKNRHNKGHGYDDNDGYDDDDGYDNKHDDNDGYKPKHKKKKPVIRPKVIIVKKLIPVSTTTAFPPTIPTTVKAPPP